MKGYQPDQPGPQPTPPPVPLLPAYQPPPTIPRVRRSFLWTVNVGCPVCPAWGRLPKGLLWSGNTVETGEDIAEEHWAKTGHAAWMEVIHRVNYTEFVPV